MGKLKIHRTENHLQKRKKVEVLIDDIIVGEIMNGETKEFEIKEGDHSLITRVKMGGKSQPIIINGNKDYSIELSISNFMIFAAGGLVCLILSKYIFPALISILIPLYLLSVIVLLVYYLTYVRTNYITMSSL